MLLLVGEGEEKAAEDKSWRAAGFVFSSASSASLSKAAWTWDLR